jgi:hypothetical protein
MAAQTDHTCFKQPQTNTVKLWKYMDFTKFVALISSGQLFHCRSDKFRDPYEGSYPIRNRESDEIIFSRIPSEYRENAIQQFYGFSEWTRQWTYISCWHVNEFESAAMWDLYAKTEEAIAIETTYEHLTLCLPDQAYIGLVEYINYNDQIIPVNNAFHPFLFKRKSFEHEREARTIIQELPYDDEKLNTERNNTIFGKNVQINTARLIQKIYISPNAADWFTDLVKEVSSKYDINAPVIKSDLYTSPIL